MPDDLYMDPEVLREQVRDKYRQVAVDPEATFEFHTGRALAVRLGYDTAVVSRLPDRAVESFVLVWEQRLATAKEAQGDNARRDCRLV